jgi:protein-disulfide isomerase
MSTPPKTTKKERRDAARERRLEAERAAGAAEQRKRRLTILGGLLATAAIVVIGAVLISSGGNSTATPKRQAGETVAGQRLSEQLLDGIPQSGITLGNPKAKVTVVEFADLQCPICQQFSQQVLPQIVQDHVRNGQAKIELRLVDILDRGGITDSARMAAVAYGAQQQDKLWNFADLQYFNQREEDTGYASDAYIKSIASGVRGLDVTKAFAALPTAGAAKALADANALFLRDGATGTPTIMVGPTGGQLQRLANFDQGSVSSAIDKAAA